MIKMNKEKIKDFIATVVAGFYVIGMFATTIICSVVAFTELTNGDTLFGSLLLWVAVINWMTIAIWVSEDMILK